MLADVSATKIEKIQLKVPQEIGYISHNKFRVNYSGLGKAVLGHT